MKPDNTIWASRRDR